MLTEILDYRLKQGMVAQFHEIMLSVSLPLHDQRGIEVVWSGPTLTNANGYCLIRCFPSLSAMEKTLAAFYASAECRQV